MHTLAEIQHAIRRLVLEERWLLAVWLEGQQSEELGATKVSEAAEVYAVESQPYMTFEEYLEFEERSETRHEYVFGFAYAMAGPTVTHSRILERLHVALRKRLPGGPCEFFRQSVKLKLKFDSNEIVYYPDLMVSCDRAGWHEKWILNPRLVVEVLSPSTERTDTREKVIAYKQVPSVEEYVTVAQYSHELTIRRCAENWVPEVVKGPEAIAEFRSLGVSVPLGEIYERVLEEALV
jgi:Uma2 family endonuclease